MFVLANVNSLGIVPGRLLILTLIVFIGCSASLVDQEPPLPRASYAERRGKYLFLANLNVYKRSMIWPVANKGVTSQFGRRAGGRFHEGLDLKSSLGDTIYAAHNGRVVFSGFMNGFGRVIVIKAGPVATIYAHNRRNLVSRGSIVERGDRIAEVGQTGHATGPHLHFEVRAQTRQGGYVAVDPRYFLA